jgi:hypothetical protein
VFVDAGLPPCDGAATASGDFLEQLRNLAVDRVLPRWSRWWDERAMEMLITDVDRRRAIEDELPEIPLAFFEKPIAVPPGWCSRPGGFLLLSESYRLDAAMATSRAWPVVELLGTHLDVVNAPGLIAEALVDLVC